jgi:drug/metabolite transporter (DMT)-like permease
METVFALIGGFLILGERIGGQQMIGCALMLTGMVVSQLGSLQTSHELPVKEIM